MKSCSWIMVFILVFLLSLSKKTNGFSQRRILHQPLFPVDTTPPPTPPSSPPPPEFSDPNQPFFPENPNGPTTPTTPTSDQNQLTPPSSNHSTPLPIATQPSNQTKKVAIAISVGLVTLGMLSALAFFLYRHRAHHSTESQKLVSSSSTSNGNVQRFLNESSAPPPGSDLLYLGTMEPSSRRSGGSESNGGNESNTNGSPSPYHKLTSLRNSEFYRPSPELHPLPPLRRTTTTTTSTTQPQTENSTSPLRTNSSSMNSSEDVFYSPNGSATGNGDTPYSPVPKQIFSTNSVSSIKNVIHTTTTSPNPHSRRSSPKSRLSFSTPDVKQVIVPSSPSPPLPSLDPQCQNSQPRTPSPPQRKSKFTSPPSPSSLNMTLPRSVHEPSLQANKIPLPPPPPPPLPPPPSMASRKDISPVTNVSTKLVQVLPRSLPMMPTPTRPTGAEVPEVIPDSSSSEPHRDVEDDDGVKPKLKPLHWDKVRATSDRAMVWDQLKSSSFHLNEDMIETLFGCNSKNPVKKESLRTSVLPPMEKENRVLDPKKSQNIAILLRALNVTRDEVSEALLEGNPDGLGAELLETLVKMAPTKEEELKLRDYSGDISKLGSAERFLKSVLDVPFAFKRVDAMLYRANFDTEVNYLRKSFETLEDACEELKNSRLFLKLLEAVLRTGNRMNVGTNRGDARAFKLDTLLKLLDIKGTDGKTTVLHFVVQEIMRSEAAIPDKSPDNLLNKVHPRVKDDDVQKKQGLQVVAGLGRELANVKKAAGMDSDVLSGYVSKLEMGLEKVRTVLQYEKSNTKGKFFDAMKVFLGEAQEEILRIKGTEKKALYHVKEVTEYFHGDTAKEEAHPFRIFMVVRDFLTVLDQVCKEVGRMREKTIVGSARSFRIPSSASLPVLNRFNIRRDVSSDEDSLSP
ncbi:hypothetical protein AQUCO_04200176v1 [Aquilegia coerulea]|uniref:Formin-like protein n=1 Tax=Aquilegia coerulea TaxID=218851 RepID=A0A2G5CPN0_AQUCA|nr:hypothetical protein AQUCO_04200176v1 [Aquilegia coerulea]PIA33236.1 hypothetical protein AQUCO_04200176v1 [Aquilegia coerulea]